jgi:crotonobetainyl-CoA:carnitine CoA-transferase CaiB-like acyl-CoA transferase
VSGPLAGIRVLDLTANISGPCATMILAGLGADVVKIERCGSGDDARSMPPHRGQLGAYFAAINRGKRSLALDLGAPEGRQIVLHLARESDVFIENFRGGKAESLGLGETAVRAENATIVYASLSAYGPRGPDFDKPGYDALGQARTGVISVTGEPGTTGARTGVSLLDMGSGMWVALGTIAALFERTRTGRGQRVDGSLYQTGIMWMAYHLVARQFTSIDPQPQGMRIGAFAPYGDFPTSDGHIMIGVSNDRLYACLRELLAIPEDARFTTNRDRVANREMLDREISSRTRLRSTADWLAAFDAAGVPASAIHTAGEVLADPQLAALRQMYPLDDFVTPRLPLEFSNFPDSPLGRPPQLGEHTREILESAGYTAESIGDLVRRRIVQCHP